ncbi:MAG: GntR family transcriptional regulator [Halieaceae bacterium]|jgi:GntR family transcriptional regulator
MSLVTGFQPLYKQVYDQLMGRLVAGEWKPSDALPSEYALAAELGVSQGTVRKALNNLVAEKLLERRQGKGTYVAEHTDESSFFRFFHFSEPGGDSLIPETQVLSVKRRVALSKERGHLKLPAKAQVAEMVRLRSLNGKPTIYETILQPLAIFPDIDKLDSYPNALYTLYQDRFGVSVVEVKEELRSVSSSARAAKSLGIKPGSPVLLVERFSISIDGRVVEWSSSYCSTSDFVYSVTLG